MGNIEEARSIIEDILSRSEFQPRSKAEIPFKEIREFFKKILEGIVNFITDILEAIFGNLDGRGNSGPSFVGNPVTLTILKAVLLVAIITVIVFICIKIIKVKNWNKKMKIVSEEEIENFIKDTDLAYSLAEKYKSAGEFRLSLRFLYISLLVQLNKKEILRLDKAKTNRQYLRELRESCPGIYSDFEKFSDAFALHWYGSRPTTSDILETWFSKYDTILERSAFSYDEK